MKKIIVIFTLIALCLALVACDKTNHPIPNKMDIFETKEIILGNKVNTVVLTTAAGEQITFDTTADFYDILNEIEFSKFEAGKKYSFYAETQVDEESKTLAQSNIYVFSSGQLRILRAQKEGDDAVAAIEEYANTGATVGYSRYSYKDELAFGGAEYGENGYINYSSNEYPVVPETGSELAYMQSRAGLLPNLFASVAFFQNVESLEIDGGTYNFEEYVTREYAFYENYMVFKQTAPFLTIPYAMGKDFYILYKSFSNSDYSITQEAYYNIKTGEIELIKVYGSTICSGVPAYLGRKVEIDMQIYIHDFAENEAGELLGNLTEYIKSNAD